MSDPPARVGGRKKGKHMYKATITTRSMIAGDHISTVEDESQVLFYAKIAGVVHGATAAGSVVTRLYFEGDAA